MTFDEPGSGGFRDSIAYRESFGARSGSRSPDEPAPAYTPGTYAVGEHSWSDFASADFASADNAVGLVGSPPPDDEDSSRRLPARDRLAIHFGWEFMLLLGAGAVGFLLYRSEPSALRGAALNALYLYVATLGFVTIGMALSVRAAVPNLSLGPLTYAAGLFFVDNSDRGLLVTGGVTALLAAAVGVLIALVVTVFQVPAWAASLAAAFGLIVWIQQHPAPVQVVNGAYRPTEHPLIWFLVFLALSVLGAALGLVPALRRRVGRYRPAADPAVRGPGAGAATLALLVSSLLAATSGVLLALHNREINPTENGIGLTGLALGAALLGGTSVYGRRGGLFGTALAVMGLALLVSYAAAEGWVVNTLGLAAAAIGVGLLVSRLVEALGRRGDRSAGHSRDPDAGPDGDGDPDDRLPEPQNGWLGSPDGGQAWTAKPPRTGEDRWDDRWVSH